MIFAVQKKEASRARAFSVQRRLPEKRKQVIMAFPLVRNSMRTNSNVELLSLFWETAEQTETVTSLQRRPIGNRQSCLVAENTATFIKFIKR